MARRPSLTALCVHYNELASPLNILRHCSLSPIRCTWFCRDSSSCSHYAECRYAVNGCVCVLGALCVLHYKSLSRPFDPQPPTTHCPPPLTNCPISRHHTPLYSPLSPPTTHSAHCPLCPCMPLTVRCRPIPLSPLYSLSFRRKDHKQFTNPEYNYPSLRIRRYYASSATRCMWFRVNGSTIWCVMSRTARRSPYMRVIYSVTTEFLFPMNPHSSSANTS